MASALRMNAQRAARIRALREGVLALVDAVLDLPLDEDGTEEDDVSNISLALLLRICWEHADQAEEKAANEEERATLAALQQAKRTRYSKALHRAEREAEKTGAKAGVALGKAVLAAQRLELLEDELPDSERRRRLELSSMGSIVARGRLDRSQSRLASLSKGVLERAIGGATDGTSEEGEAGGQRFALSSGMGTSALSSDDAAAAKGMALDAAAAASEALEDEEEIEGGLSSASGMAKWLQPWLEAGGAKSAEMPAFLTVQSDCLDLDGDCLACIGGDGQGTSVSTFSAASGQVTHNFKGHSDRVLCVAVEGDKIASGSRDKTIMLWSRSSGKHMATMECEEPVHGLAMRRGQLLSSEGKAGSPDGVARLWSVTASKLLALLHEHAGAIWGVALGVSLAVTASHDKTARVWPISEKKGKGKADTTSHLASIATLTHPEWVCTVAIAADDSIAATGCADGRVRLWSLLTFACLRTLDHSSQDVAAVSGDDSRIGPVFSVRLFSGALVSGGFDQSVKVWSLSSDGDAIATLDHGAVVRGIVASPRQGFIATAGGRTKEGLVIWRPVRSIWPGEHPRATMESEKNAKRGGPRISRTT